MDADGREWTDPVGIYSCPFAVEGRLRTKEIQPRMDANRGTRLVFIVSIRGWKSVVSVRGWIKHVSIAFE
jgi:hypothetical protein